MIQHFCHTFLYFSLTRVESGLRSGLRTFVSRRKNHSRLDILGFSRSRHHAKHRGAGRHAMGDIGLSCPGLAASLAHCVSRTAELGQGGMGDGTLSVFNSHYTTHSSRHAARRDGRHQVLPEAGLVKAVGNGGNSSY